MNCPRCNDATESIEHLFFECLNSKRLWRASNLGFNFDLGEQVPFHSWWQSWSTDASNTSHIYRSIAILWGIWITRNKALFDQQFLSLQESNMAIEEAFEQMEDYNRNNICSILPNGNGRHDISSTSSNGKNRNVSFGTARSSIGFVGLLINRVLSLLMELGERISF